MRPARQDVRIIGKPHRIGCVLAHIAPLSRSARPAPHETGRECAHEQTAPMLACIVT